MDRREFLKDSSLLGVAAIAVGGDRANSADAEPANAMPTIKLGNLPVSRLILGSNPFWGYAHKPGSLGREMREYYTDDRIMEVLEQAATHGVTTVTSPPEKRWNGLFRKYVDGGGKLKTWIAQCHWAESKMSDEIKIAADAGANGIFIQGHRVEVQFERNTFGKVREWIEQIKALGLPAGMAAHRPDIHPEAEEQGFPTDFYFQCFFNVAHGETYDVADRQKAVETIALIDKPVIGYKILGAGRLKPQDAFAFALKHLRPTDGMCVGIFPKEDPDQIAEDTTLARGESYGA